MNWLQTLIILGVAFLAVYLQCTFNGLRYLFGAQFDLLPSLMVYTSLSCGPVSLALVATFGGLCLDSLSANPLGTSILPLFAVGFVIQYYRGLILRNQLYAQWVLGMAASAAVPVLTVVLLASGDKQPLLGWVSLWQLLVVTLQGGAFAPLCFKVLDRVLYALSYREIEAGGFRPDREIKRGRI